MSVLYSNERGCFISHLNFITKVYSTTSRGTNMCKFVMRNDLFKILHPFKSDGCNIQCVDEAPSKKRKLKRKSTNPDPVAVKVKDFFEQFIKSIGKKGVFLDNVSETTKGTNIEARKAADVCTTSSAELNNVLSINGGNAAPTALFQHFRSCDILLPANCRFICDDVRTYIAKLNGEKYNYVVLDPPWWNKYIRRSKAKKLDSGYKMLYNEELVNLPLKGLLSGGAVVAVWCTNCTAHETAIKEQMFPAWGVTYSATWFWMKVTTSGAPVCPFTDLNGKQPFEKIIIGIHSPLPDQLAPQEERILVSVPSALHSHKPPLNDVLAPYISSEAPKCLEVFARYLLPNTTSLGLEPLKWQHSSLYTEDL